MSRVKGYFDNLTVLKDCMHNLAADSGASDEYRRGLIVGVVSALIAAGFDFKTALYYTRDCSPSRESFDRLAPESWRVTP